MPTTEIPPKSSAPASQSVPRPQGGDLYDAAGWESAYVESHDVPALLIQLRDDLSRSRQREAFWISVVVHLTLVILIVNSPKFDKYLFRRAVVMVSPNDMLREKELTYLNLPPDEQKLTKRPTTDKISDKDRIATSRAPQLNREELRKILDSARAGAPGGGSPAMGAQSPSAQSNPSPQQPQAQPATQSSPPPQDQVAKLQTPPVNAPKPSFSITRPSPGSAIEQAARAAIANRGSYGGDDGDYGLGQGRQPTEAIGPMEVLSDTMGVDFGPYLARVLHDVQDNWYRIIPESAMAPLMKKGKVSIVFDIMKDGGIQGLQIVSGSGDVALDRAAYGGITASTPFPPLPREFGGQYLALRFHFFYNYEKADLQ